MNEYRIHVRFEHVAGGDSRWHWFVWPADSDGFDADETDHFCGTKWDAVPGARRRALKRARKIAGLLADAHSETYVPVKDHNALLDRIDQLEQEVGIG